MHTFLKLYFFIQGSGIGVGVLNWFFLGLGFTMDGVLGLWCEGTLVFGVVALYINILE